MSWLRLLYRIFQVRTPSLRPPEVPLAAGHFLQMCDRWSRLGVCARMPLIVGFYFFFFLFLFSSLAYMFRADISHLLFLVQHADNDLLTIC